MELERAAVYCDDILWAFIGALQRAQVPIDQGLTRPQGHMLLTFLDAGLPAL